MRKNKIKLHKMGLLAGYFCLILPIIFSVFYSVPASDDFIYGTFASSDNLILNALGYVKHTYWQGSCRWLIFFLQKCINPLNLYSLFGIHLGHIYGICDIVVFAISIALIIYSIRFIVGKIVNDEKVSEIVAFLVIALLLSTYYYSEVYNWYTGATAYAIPFSLTLLLFVTIINYFENGNSKKDYILLFVVGILPATNEFLCVPIGIVYLMYLLQNYKFEANKKTRIKNVLPLIYYIIMGCTVVFAPGTFARRDRTNVTAPIWRLMLQAIINIVVRIKDIIVSHPFAVILLILVFFFGVISKGNKKHDILKYVLVFGIGTLGAILPYCLGRGFSNTYMDVRMYYILDYCLLISMALTVLMLGQNFALHFDIDMDKRAIIRWSMILTMFAYLMLVPQNLYLKIPQIDIIKKSGLIRESYALWDGILTEIENSDEKNVVITRDKQLEWSPYFLYVGMEPGEVYDEAADVITPINKIMINVYYKKNTITLIYND